ncbi:MAG TPA: hypothetical protein DDY17_06060 [Syntrophaceae bacterium]|jgi:hypothetical protein|nr:hypothetical protein [Syntrophaceae bacterium]
MDATSKHSMGVLNGGGRAVEDTRDHDIIIDGRLLKPDDRIYSLVDVADHTIEGDSKKDREIIVIDGRVYERVSRPDDTVYDHTDVVGKGSVGPVFDTGLNEEIMKRVTETAERIAKEMVPEIAERVIREEIDKLKK